MSRSEAEALGWQFTSGTGFCRAEKTGAKTQQTATEAATVEAVEKWHALQASWKPAPPEAANENAAYYAKWAKASADPKVA